MYNVGYFLYKSLYNRSNWEAWLAKQPTAHVSRTGRQYYRTSTGRLVPKPLTPPPEAVKVREKAGEVEEKKSSGVTHKRYELPPILERTYRGKRIAFEVLPEGGFRYIGDPVEVEYVGEKKLFKPGSKKLPSIAFFIKDLTGGKYTWQQFFEVKKKEKSEGWPAYKSDKDSLYYSPYRDIEAGRILERKYKGVNIKVKRLLDGDFLYLGDSIDVIGYGDKKVKISYGKKLRPSVIAHAISQITEGKYGFRKFFDLPDIYRASKKEGEGEGEKIKADDIVKPETEEEKKEVKRIEAEHKDVNIILPYVFDRLNTDGKFYDDAYKLGVEIYDISLKEYGIALYIVKGGKKHYQLAETVSSKEEAIEYSGRVFFETRGDIFDKKFKAVSKKESDELGDIVSEWSGLKQEEGGGMKKVEDWEVDVARLFSDIVARKASDKEVKEHNIKSKDAVVLPFGHNRAYVSKKEDGKYHVDFVLSEYDPYLDMFKKREESAEFDSIDDKFKKEVMNKFKEAHENEERVDDFTEKYGYLRRFIREIQAEYNNAVEAIDSNIFMTSNEKKKLREEIDKINDEIRQIVVGLWNGDKGIDIGKAKMKIFEAKEKIKAKIFRL